MDSVFTCHIDSMTNKTLVISGIVWFTWTPPHFVRIEIICRSLLDNDTAIVLYSLTKYSAIFAEVKGYFGITEPDNQLGPMSWFFLKSNNQLECLESGWSKLCSLRNQYRYWLDNQLERAIIERGDSMIVLCLCATIWNTLHESFSLGTDTSINWKMGALFECQRHWDVKL